MTVISWLRRWFTSIYICEHCTHYMVKAVHKVGIVGWHCMRIISTLNRGGDFYAEKSTEINVCHFGTRGFHNYSPPFIFTLVHSPWPENAPLSSVTTTAPAVNSIFVQYCATSSDFCNCVVDTAPGYLQGYLVSVREVVQWQRLRSSTSDLALQQTHLAGEHSLWPALSFGISCQLLHEPMAPTYWTISNEHWRHFCFSEWVLCCR